MKRFLPLLLLAISLHTASADVLIYKAVEKVAAAGGENNGNLLYHGYWIIDLGTTNINYVRFNTVNGQKTYGVGSISHALLARVDGKGSSSTVLCKGGIAENFSQDIRPWFSSIYIKGKNQDLTLRTSGTATYPKTFTGQGRQVVLSAGGDYLITFEASLSFAYAQSLTVTSNDAGNDAQTVLNGLIDQLQSDGYQLSN